LWVRPTTVLDGLRAADWVLDAGGFGLVVLYLAGASFTQNRFARPRGETPWIRLARRAEKAKAALVVVGDQPMVGTVAATSLAAQRGRARWLGGERGGPRILDGVDGRIVVARSKLGAPSATAEVPLALAPAGAGSRR
jgi:hypothetical protein